MVAFDTGMRGPRLLIVLSGLPALVFGAMIRLHFETLPRIISAESPAIEWNPRDSAAREVHGAELESRTDLYGNRIDAAVAKYRIDSGGRIYELHAPDTAVSKLLPPEM